MLHTRSIGGLFNLSRLRAKTKTKLVLIRELLYADDAALVAHSEVHLQNLCERFAKACSDFSMTINLKKTVVMSLGTSSPPRILTNGSSLNVVDKFSYLGSIVNSSKIWTMKSANELERLRLTWATYFSGLEKSPPRNQTKDQSLHRLHPECSVIQRRDLVHIPPPRKPAQSVSFQMPSLHSWCLVVMDGSCPQLHHPASQQFI